MEYANTKEEARRTTKAAAAGSLHYALRTMRGRCALNFIADCAAV
jgi:hypothetical protein